MAQEEVARLRLGRRRSRSGSRRRAPRRAARRNARGRTRSSLDHHLEQARGGLCALERLDVRVGRSRSRSRGGRRRAARAGSSRPARDTCRPARRRARRARGSSEPTLTTLPVGSGPGCRGEEADRERLLEVRQRELVGDRLAERLPQRDLDEVDADGVPDEVGHLAAGNPRRDLDHEHAVVGDEELREGDAVAQPERLRRVRGDACGLRERVARRSSPGTRGSSRRRSRCPAGGGGRRA